MEGERVVNINIEARKKTVNKWFRVEFVDIITEALKFNLVGSD